MTTILWRSERLQSAELAELQDIPQGTRLSGLVLAAVEGRPVRLAYQIDCDEGWRTRSVEVTRLEDGRSRLLALASDGDGRWTVDGTPAPDLDGCIDVDMEWTPATNTLPIRRAAGRSIDVCAAWVRFPGLTVERLEQTYTPLENGRWRYSSASGAFMAELTVDDEGLVIDYEGIWRAVAHSEPSRLESSRLERPAG